MSAPSRRAYLRRDGADTDPQVLQRDRAVVGTVIERPERRQFRRVSLAGTADVVAGRIRPGVVVRVLDLSRGGGLIESGARLLPGANVDLQLESADARATIRARVVRCFVGSVSPARIVFRGALEFDAPLPAASVVDVSNCDSGKCGN